MGAPRGILRGDALGFGVVFRDCQDRDWWAGMGADRVVGSALADHAIERGLATTADLHRIAEAWRRWATADDGWYTVIHGEIRATP
jgi:hypothetical protein